MKNQPRDSHGRYATKGIEKLGKSTYYSLNEKIDEIIDECAALRKAVMVLQSRINNHLIVSSMENSEPLCKQCGVAPAYSSSGHCRPCLSSPMYGVKPTQKHTHSSRSSVPEHEHEAVNPVNMQNRYGVCLYCDAVHVENKWYIPKSEAHHE